MKVKLSELIVWEVFIMVPLEFQNGSEFAIHVVNPTVNNKSYLPSPATLSSESVRH